MSAENVQNIAFKWISAFNSHNLEQLLDLYDDEAQHYSPRLKLINPDSQGKLIGKDNLRLWWQESFSKLPTLQYKPVNFTANVDRIFIEYIRSVAGENDALIAEVLSVKNGKIIESRVYIF